MAVGITEWLIEYKYARKGTFMNYPAIFKPAPEGGFVVTFRDIPEAITQGDTKAEAMEMAEDVLFSAIEVYFDEKRTVPLPGKAKRGERLVSIQPSVWAKVLLLTNDGPARDSKRIGTAHYSRRLFSGLGGGSEK
jgi:antitoxin HicB